MNVQQQGTWYLRVIQGPAPGEAYAIERSLVTVGRGPDNDIVIDVPGVSRQHARLTYQEGWFYVEDLNSQNGVYVDGVRIDAPQPVQLGAQMMLGSSVTFVLEWVPAVDPSAEQTAVMGYAPTAPQGVSPGQEYDAPTAQWQAPQGAHRGLPFPPQPQPEPVYQQQPTSSGVGTTLFFVGCGLVLLVVAIVGIVGALMFTNVLPNPFAAPTTTPTLMVTATATALVETPLPTATWTPVPVTAPTNTPYPTYTPYPTFTLVPRRTATHTPSPTPLPTHTDIPTYTPYPTYTLLPTSTPRPTDTPPAPTRTSTPTRRPPTPTSTPAGPLSMDWVLEDKRCLSKAEWVAVFKITVSGGSGQYTYFRDVEQIHGPTNAKTYTYELRYGMSAAVGTLRVRSGAEEASKKFYIPHPNCG